MQWFNNLVESIGVQGVTIVAMIIMIIVLLIIILYMSNKKEKELEECRNKSAEIIAENKKAYDLSLEERDELIVDLNYKLDITLRFITANSNDALFEQVKDRIHDIIINDKYSVTDKPALIQVVVDQQRKRNESQVTPVENSESESPQEEKNPEESDETEEQK